MHLIIGKTYARKNKKWVEVTGGGSGGTSDYSDLDNKPKINNVELEGNKTSSDLGIITKDVDDLLNYYKKSETFTKQEVNDLINAITTMDLRIVESLPVEDISTTTIYLVPKSEAETNNAYDEYIYVSNSWEFIGSTEVDLTDYVMNTDYATVSKGGVVRINSTYGLNVAGTGTLIGVNRSFSNYQSVNDLSIISKGTLENVLRGYGLID